MGEGVGSELLNHRITVEDDYSITLLKFGELFVLALLNFQIVIRRISPARYAKEADLASFRIDQFSTATTSLHFDQLLFNSGILFSFEPVRDDFVGADIFREASELSQAGVSSDRE